MKRFVEGEDRLQGVLLPEFLDDYVAEDNLVRVIDVFVDELDLRALGFEGRRSGSDRSACLSSRDAAEDLPLRLSQSYPSRAGGSNGRANATSS